MQDRELSGPVTADELPPGGALPRPVGRAGLLACAAFMVLFLGALVGLTMWIAGRPSRVAAARPPLVPVVALAAPAAPAAAPAAAARPEAPPVAEAESDRQGLALTITRPGQQPGVGDTRAARMIGLYVPQGTAPTPFLDPGPFVATFEGSLEMRLRDSYSFAAIGRGKLTVTINDQPALDAAGDDFSQKQGEAVRLNKGKNKIVVRYESPAQGDAAVRLLWTVKGESLPDPIPPQVLKHNAGAKPAAEGRRVREGRFLLAQLRCVKCHLTPESDRVPPVVPVHPAEAIKPGPMPELAMDAPSLGDAGARLNKAWMAAWVNNPQAVRPDAHMPRLFHAGNGGKAADGNAIDPRAADVAAYLASLGGNPAEVEAPTEEKAQAGGVLYATLNCVACHTPPDAPAAAEGAPEATAAADNADQPDAATALASRRVPHKHVKAKFSPAGLKQYLLKPHAHYKWNPMPDFKLTEDEAEALSAYLLVNGEAELPGQGEMPAGDPAKGKVLVTAAGCINCHTIGTEKIALIAPSLWEIPKDGWSRGCMAADPAARKQAPDYPLKEPERTALLAFTATDLKSLGREALPEFADRQAAAMRCVTCHARDGNESLLATTLDAEQKELEGKFPVPPPKEPGADTPAPPPAAEAEVFAPDQRAPLLTWAGEKLRPEWMASFVAGQVPYKPRPYLRARMPAFDARAGGLSAGLAMEHGCPPVSEPHGKPDAEMAAVGSKLAGKTPNEAFSCVQCHAVADAPPFAPFEAPAVNFAYSAERLRKDYYHRWVHNPIRLDPNTKMPAFEREDGKTTITNVYEGDARKQFEAMWQYLLEGKDIKPPAE